MVFNSQFWLGRIRDSRSSKKWKPAGFKITNKSNNQEPFCDWTYNVLLNVIMMKFGWNDFIKFRNNSLLTYLSKQLSIRQGSLLHIPGRFLSDFLPYKLFWRADDTKHSHKQFPILIGVSVRVKGFLLGFSNEFSYPLSHQTPKYHQLLTWLKTTCFSYQTVIKSHKVGEKII